MNMYGVAEIDGFWFVVTCADHRPVSPPFATQGEAWRCYDREFDGGHLADIDRHNRIRDAFAQP
jgi:hypothetical protein